MRTQRLQLKGYLLWLVRGARHAGARDLYFALGALVSPVEKFFLTVHYSNLCVPIALQPGQAVVRGRLSLNVCLRSMLCSSLLRKYGKWKEWGAAHPERIFMTAFFFEVLSYTSSMLI